MCPSPDADSKDFELDELDADLELTTGPTIDSSDEFPLPSFDPDDGIDADVLFPLGGDNRGEKTSEDKAVVDDNQESVKHSEAAKKRYPAIPTVSLSDNDLSDYGRGDYRNRDRSDYSDRFTEDTLDSDYFEAGLDSGEERRRERSKAAPAKPEPKPPERVQPAEPVEESKPEQKPESGASEQASSPNSEEVEPESPKAPPPPAQRKPSQGRRKKSVRPWVPAAGVACLVVAWFASKPLFQGLSEVEVSVPARVVASRPQGEVFVGEESLGTGPVPLSPDQAKKPATVRLKGYVPLSVPPLTEIPTEGPVSKFLQPLEVAPVALNWSGLPDGSTVWWNGKKSTLDGLQEVLPGDYKVKVKAPDRPAVQVGVSVGVGESVDVSKKVAEALARQPQVKLGVTPPDEKTKVGSVSLKVSRIGEGTGFTETVKLGPGKSAELNLPEPGKYKVAFAGDQDFKAASKTVELAEGGSEDVTLGLVKRPPKQVAPSNPGNTYRPNRPTYRPPVYRPRPRPSGGGSGRIRPPAF